MIKHILEDKYGHFITNQFLTNSNEVMRENYNFNGKEQQLEVKNHLKNLKGVDGNPLLPDKFLSNDVEWGMDFSSWIGEFKKSKNYFIIGAEPHINNNYQLVYDFGSLKDTELSKIAQIHYGRESDIWYYLTNFFIEDDFNSEQHN